MPHHNLPGKIMHVTSICSQMQKEPMQSLSWFLILCLPPMDGAKKVIIILLNKSLYFKKLLVFGEEKDF